MYCARLTVSLIVIAAMLDTAIGQTPQRLPAPRPAPLNVEASHYCVSGSAGFLTSEEQGIEATKLKCKRGDTLIIPAAKTRIVARLCDFTRAVIVAEGNVVCVLAGIDRAER